MPVSIITGLLDFMRTYYGSRYSVYLKFVGHNLKVPIFMFVIGD